MRDSIGELLPWQDPGYAYLRALGDYLIVGIHNDANVNRRRGRNYPIMNLNER